MGVSKSDSGEQTQRPVVTVTFFNFELLEELHKLSQEFDRPWDYLVNVAIERLISDVRAIRELRNTRKIED